MSRKNKLIGTLHVIGVGVLSYLGQVSHVPAETVAKWTLHEWVGAGLFVLLAVLSAWKLFLTNPNDILRPNNEK